MFLKLKNDNTLQGFFHGSFQNIESTDRESMEVCFKFNPFHFPDDDMTFCFEANITDDLRSKLKGFGVEMDETDSKDDSEDSEYANKLQCYLFQNGDIGPCS